MATTQNGIYYPDDYNQIADVPEDMKKQAESVEQSIRTINTSLNNKVDKVEGKTLSTNDFDNTYKGNVDSNTNARHTHLNKSVLDDISSTDINNWNGKGTYSKPSDGIPKTDLASDIQTSLGKANTAIQEHQDISGKVDKVAGKSLISNTEIERLANVDNYDDSEVMQDISNIQEEQTEQNTNIQALQEENEVLKSIIKQLPNVKGEGEEVTLENTIEAPMEVEVGGNTKQDSRSGRSKPKPRLSSRDTQLW